MAETTGIAWTDHTFNPWIGCQRVSPGCENCYAEAMARRAPALVLGPGPHNVGHPTPRTWGPEAPRRVTSDANWREPVRWDRAAAKAGVRRKVFCASLADVFEDRRELDGARARLWALVEATPHLDWLLLTKRPQNILSMVPMSWAARIPGTDQIGGRLPANVWIGTTAEDQQRAEERLPHLLRVPAVVRFVSYEPALGPVDFAGRRWLEDWDDAPAGWAHGRIDWLIVGGESGTSARPFDLAWARSALEQCREAQVPCFVKQMGAAPRGPHDEIWRLDGIMREGCGHYTRRITGKGDDPTEWPADLQVREFPEVRP